MILHQLEYTEVRFCFSNLDYQEEYAPGEYILRQVAMQWQMGMYLHNSLPKIEFSKSICIKQIKEGGKKRSNNSQVMTNYLTLVNIL